MTWNYSGRPGSSDRDQVRFLMGDTCEDDPLVQDEEVTYAVSEQSTLKLAAAMCLRALAAKFSRRVTTKVGDISKNCSDLAKAFKDRADELDPLGQATMTSRLIRPSFGGLTVTGKDALDDDDNAVQPRFKREMFDYQ